MFHISTSVRYGEKAVLCILPIPFSQVSQAYKYLCCQIQSFYILILKDSSYFFGFFDCSKWHKHLLHLWNFLFYASMLSWILYISTQNFELRCFTTTPARQTNSWDTGLSEKMMSSLRIVYPLPFCRSLLLFLSHTF